MVEFVTERPVKSEGDSEVEDRYQSKAIQRATGNIACDGLVGVRNSRNAFLILQDEGSRRLVDDDDPNLNLCEFQPGQ